MQKRTLEIIEKIGAKFTPINQSKDPEEWKRLRTTGIGGSDAGAILGLNKYSENNNMGLIQTKVGDRYVLEEMLKNDYNFGGEQSGHVIMLDYNPTGDGILTSLMLLKSILDENKKVSEVKRIINIYPQVLINAKVLSDKKHDYEKDEEIQKEIKALEEEFSGNGRVLIRPSGTEPKVRVMIEGADKEYITEKAQNLADLIEKKLGK